MAATRAHRDRTWPRALCHAHAVLSDAQESDRVAVFHVDILVTLHEAGRGPSIAPAGRRNPRSRVDRHVNGFR